MRAGDYLQTFRRHFIHALSSRGRLAFWLGVSLDAPGRHDNPVSQISPLLHFFPQSTIRRTPLCEMRMHILHGYAYSILITGDHWWSLRLDIRLAASQLRDTSTQQCCTFTVYHLLSSLFGKGPCRRMHWQRFGIALTYHSHSLL
jgi:hypothetical protein